MHERDTVRIGIVGLGGIARHHADQFAALADEGVPVTLAGGMDIDADAREAFGDDYDVRTFGDADALYETVDAVVVTTPNCFHEEYVVSALDAGLDVLVEKPLAHTVESAERIAASARTADGFCMVGFHNRFAPEVRALKARVDDGRLGDLYHVDASYVRRRGVPGRGSWFTDADAAGGGALIDIGAHAIDLALHLMDFPEVVEVAGTTRSTFGGREEYTYLEMWGEDGSGEFTVDDSAHALLRCADGQTIALETSWAANRPPETAYVVEGTEAGAALDRTEESLTIYGVDDVGGPQFTDTTVTTDGDPAHRTEGRRFVEAVAAGDPPGTNTVAEALAVQRVVAAIYESAATGGAVDLADGLAAEADD
ncbi:Gfo/Idh/MocA family protein [Halorubellus salinus]|uniref:Gfo/Idh/MocA family protein n=1 Tax=Halorubellus salinus TaxID=755309 RepID=UPI001D08616F|nr:Gfo/Idh/MocA family oxidoreductase [Halorubellus salinus]